MNNLVEHAKSELKIMFGPEPEGYEANLTKSVQELIELFSKQGHTGTSLADTVALFVRLSQHITLAPLTGEDTEWDEVKKEHYPTYLKYDDGDRFWQNNRCGRVFKAQYHGENSEPEYFDVEGIVLITMDSNSQKLTRRIDSFPYDPADQMIQDLRTIEPTDNTNSGVDQGE